MITIMQDHDKKIQTYIHYFTYTDVCIQKTSLNFCLPNSFTRLQSSQSYSKKGHLLSVPHSGTEPVTMCLKSNVLAYISIGASL